MINNDPWIAKHSQIIYNIYTWYARQSSQIKVLVQGKYLCWNISIPNTNSLTSQDKIPPWQRTERVLDKFCKECSDNFNHQTIIYAWTLFHPSTHQGGWIVWIVWTVVLCKVSRHNNYEKDKKRTFIETKTVAVLYYAILLLVSIKIGSSTWPGKIAGRDNVCWYHSLGFVRTNQLYISILKYVYI